jgi:hypothetical protein
VSSHPRAVPAQTVRTGQPPSLRQVGERRNGGERDGARRVKVTARALEQLVAQAAAERRAAERAERAEQPCLNAEQRRALAIAPLQPASPHHLEERGAAEQQREDEKGGRLLQRHPEHIAGQRQR